MRRVFNAAACAALALFPIAAFGQALDLTPDSTRYLSDPNYLPSAGQIYAYSQYTHNWTNGDNYNSLGSQTTSFNINTDTLTQFLSYGITDDFEVNATIHYEPGSTRQVNFANGTSESIGSSGFTDPSFGAVWRVLDEGSASPVDFDVFGSFSPDWASAEFGSTTSDGSPGLGGNSGILGAAIGYETRQFSIRGSFDANIVGQTNALNLATGQTLQTQGYTDYTLTLATQTRLNPLFSVNAGIDHTFAANQNALNTSTGITHITQPGDSTALRVALNYNVVPDQAVLSLGYTHEFLDNTKFTYAIPAADGSVRNRYANILGLQLDYVLP